MSFENPKTLSFRTLASMLGDARDLVEEARRELVEAYRASRMLKVHAIMPILAVVVTGILQAVLLVPLYNPLALSQVSPAKRVEFIASSLADFVAYTGVVTSIFSLLTWLFMGLAIVHVSRVFRLKWEPLGLVIVVVAALASVLLGYNSIVVRDVVYRASLEVLSRPEIASIIADMSVRLSREELEAYAEALAQVLARMQSPGVSLTAILASILSIVPPILAALAFEPIARSVRSKWPRILQMLLVLMVVQTVVSHVALPGTAIVGIILSLVNILEPVAAWLTANRVRSYVEEKLVETQ